MVSGKRKDPPTDGWPPEAAEETFVCFVRHAQALHNVCDSNLWTPDNPLTKEGERQCETARKEWGSKVFADAELIVVSPMTRALMTAFNFNGKTSDDRWLVSPMCAEQLSGATCDEGTPKSKQLEKLPWMAKLRGVDELDEEWWLVKRPEEERRVSDFIDFLANRSERKVVVVSHGGFLEYVVGYHMHNAHHHLMSVAELVSVKQKLHRSLFNCNRALVAEYENKPLRALVHAPLFCLQGIGRKKAGLLAQLGPKTVQGLASWKFAKWAEAICILASTEEAGTRDLHQEPAHMNINKALDTAWEGSSMTELLDAPVSALEGVPSSQDAMFRSMGIKTIKDLGTWKYYMWARAMCTLSDVETVDGSS